MSAISLTDEFKAAEIVAKANRGDQLAPEEIVFLECVLEEREPDLIEALRPRRRR
jgi:hypothetical protein